MGFLTQCVYKLGNFFPNFSPTTKSFSTVSSHIAYFRNLSNGGSDACTFVLVNSLSTHSYVATTISFDANLWVLSSTSNKLKLL